MIRAVVIAASVCILLALSGCTIGGNQMRDGGPRDPFFDGGFICYTPDVVACRNNIHYSCEPNGEFLSAVMQPCGEVLVGDPPRPAVCYAELGCVLCVPNGRFCDGNNVAECNGTGDGFTVIEECDGPAGQVCQQGRCENLCDLAFRERSYVGCEFYPVDLDNASINILGNASAQQYSVVVSNPSGLATDVWVERNNAPQGDPVDVEEIDRVTVLPGDLEVFNLPRREVDGSSSLFVCTAVSQCLDGESCWCSDGLRVDDPTGTHVDCRCKRSAAATGVNDGTHSALSSRAYRIRSVLPIIAYQFNPLDNVGVYSNEASLLLPTSALPVNSVYTAIGWPQTIATSIDLTEDWHADLRATLTIVGTTPRTHVTVTLGPQVRRVIGIGGRGDGVPGTVWEFDIGPFDVINLETGGFNADFTGTIVEADQRVALFSGSEASDAPFFDTVANRQCCADHLEEQLMPNDALGRHFVIGRMTPRTRALNEAFLDPSVDQVGEFNEPEYVRIVAVASGTTYVTTTNPDYPEIPLEQGQNITLDALQDFEITADKPVAVLQVISSQETIGIPFYYPGGDPSIIVVPPVEQYRSDYVFLTPNRYAFDFVTITAPRLADILLDEMPIDDWNCEVAAGDGVRRGDGDPPPEHLVYRCQLSFPDVAGRNAVLDGIQNDGYHTLRSNMEIGVVVSGWDRYVSYAYPGGLDLDAIQ